MAAESKGLIGSEVLSETVSSATYLNKAQEADSTGPGQRSETQGLMNLDRRVLVGARRQAGLHNVVRRDSAWTLMSTRKLKVKGSRVRNFCRQTSGRQGSSPETFSRGYGAGWESSAFEFL